MYMCKDVILRCARKGLSRPIHVIRYHIAVFCISDSLRSAR